jgi:predicted lipid-binding transport protein (Tim44 family)
MKHSLNKPYKTLTIMVGFFFIFSLGMESLALARAGGGGSSGSRGYSSGGSYQRSAPSQPRQPQAPPQRPSPQPPVQPPSMGKTFLSGLGGGLVGGMLGSMLFSGRGFAGGGSGVGGGGGGFGFVDLILLLAVLGVIYFVVKRYRARKKAMEMTGTGGAAYATSYGYSNEPAPEPYYAPQPNQEDPVSAGLRAISYSDPSFDEYRFKETVGDYFFKIQAAWTKRDLGGIKYLLTSQMLNTFQEDVNKYQTNKQINRLENIAARQVEIVDAAQDQGVDYITVKFLASLLDYVVDETDNRVISGNSTDPVKFLEYWTFTRRTGERNWLLTGITQEGDYR